MRRSFLATLILIPFIVLCPLSSLAADSESLGQQAEQAGKLREALTHYVSALQSASEGSSKDQQLREKIIILAQKLTPPPAVPEEAEKYLMRGQGAVEIAKTPDDYLVAIAEFKKAARLAPWWADIYYNLGLVQDKAGLYADGIRSLKLCLKAAPNAPDAKKIELMIVKLEFKQEQAQKEASVNQQEEGKRQQAEQEKQRIKQLFASLPGRWKSSCLPTGRREDPSNPCEIAIINGVLEYRCWSGILGEWSLWPSDLLNTPMGMKYPDAPNSYRFRLENSLLISLSGKYRDSFQVITSDYMVEKTSSGNCEWRRVK